MQPHWIIIFIREKQVHFLQAPLSRCYFLFISQHSNELFYSEWCIFAFISWLTWLRFQTLITFTLKAIFFFWVGTWADLTIFSETSSWFEHKTLNDDFAAFHLALYSNRAKESENVGKRANCLCLLLFFAHFRSPLVSLDVSIDESGCDCIYLIVISMSDNNFECVFRSKIKCFN